MAVMPCLSFWWNDCSRINFRAYLHRFLIIALADGKFLIHALTCKHLKSIVFQTVPIH